MLKDRKFKTFVSKAITLTASDSLSLQAPPFQTILPVDLTKNHR